jgi:NAD(P)H-hydrate epimerase
MEAAGWQLARHCLSMTAVLCGKGNNGGDALAAARHLRRWGRLAGVACVDRPRLSGPAAREALALEAMGVEIRSEPLLEGAQLILDGLLGTGLSRAPEGRYAEWIEMANASGKRIVSADLPSGLEADTGMAHSPTIRAALTVTFGLPKTGLLIGDGPAAAGVVWVVDIGIPPEAYATTGAPMPEHLYSMHDRFELRGITP